MVVKRFPQAFDLTAMWDCVDWWDDDLSESSVEMNLISLSSTQLVSRLICARATHTHTLPSVQPLPHPYP